MARRATPPFPRLGAVLLRRRYVVLAGLCVVAGLAALNLPFRDDWSFFVWAARLLVGDHPPWATEPGGLHLYANYQVQIGPLTLVTVQGLRLVFGYEGARIAAMTLMMGAGLGIIVVLERGGRALHGDGSDDDRWRRWMTLLGGAIVLFAWGRLATYSVHVDDGLTVLAASCALAAVAKGRPALAGLLLGLGVAAKPWGIVLLPVALAFQGSARRRCLIAAAGTIAVTWLPFFLADPGTLSAGEARVVVDPASVLALFGVEEGSSLDWIRAVQVVVASGLVAMAVLSGRWPAAVMVGVAARLLLDPAVFEYYSVGLVVGVFAWEMLRFRRPFPVCTTLAFWLLQAPSLVRNPDFDRVEGLLRLIACGLALAVAFGVAPGEAVDVDRRRRSDTA